MAQTLTSDDQAIWAEADTEAGARPGARAHEVLRTFGVAGAPLPDDPDVDWADPLTRSRAVARVLLLVAPVSLAAALAAAEAAWAGDYAPARAAPKNPTAYWAAAAVILRAATAADAPRPWPAHLSGVHAASAAGAEAAWEVGRRVPALPLPPDATLDALYFLHRAALSCDPPRFVCDVLQRNLAPAMAPWAADALGRLCALLDAAVAAGAPPPRDVFGAYAGLLLGLAAQHALPQPPRPAGGVPESGPTADGRVLAHCQPVVLDAPLHNRALYHAAYGAAGEACDHAIRAGAWKCATHLMSGYPFSGDALSLGALPVPTPPPPRFEPAPMFADGAAVLWRVYDHAAQLVHTRRAPAVGAAIERRLRALAGHETRWRAVRGPPARLRAVFEAMCALGDGQPCMVPLPGVIHVEVGTGDEWHRRFCGRADVDALLDNVE